MREPISMPDRHPIPIAGVPDGVVLYDGVCVLCSGLFRFVTARDPEAFFRFTAIQSSHGHWLALRLGIDPGHPRTNAVILDGHAFLGADAVIQILSRLRGWCWLARMAWLVPRPVRNWLYDRVARDRYRWFGQTETCMIPDPALARHIFPDGPPRD